MFSKQESKTNPWKEIDVRVIPWILRWCTDFQYILNSQASPAQLLGQGCNLICVALYAPEWSITKDRFLLKQAQGTLSKLLDPVQLQRINDSGANPFALVLDDLNNVLLNPARFGVSDKKIVPLKKGVTYDQNDNSSLYVVFSMEGCHSAAGSYDKKAITADGLIKNITTLAAQVPLISINLCHLEQNPLCNHAFGILFVASEEFKPVGREITDMGRAIIRHCYTKKIMVDLKHMSLGARRFLIEKLRPSVELQAINQPLVCTHAGFTGLSYADIPDYMTLKSFPSKGYAQVEWSKPKRFESNTWTAFNPCSINLYDEDILAILQSGGIIGLSMDKRILGFSEANTLPDAMNDLVFEEEYISLQEQAYFVTKRSLGKKMTETYCITTSEVLEGGQVNPDVSYYHLCHFMSHILHLLYVCNKYRYDSTKALSQICIGSDFDGIINPVWCCPSSANLAAFKKMFIDEFPFFAKANKSIVALPAGFEVHTFANKLFFENGRDFVLNRIAKL